MILSYTLPGAKEMILDGRKIHTMRADRVNRWKPGNEIHHATGNRSKEYNCFLINRCISTQQVLLVKLDTGEIKATVDRRRLSAPEVKELAKNDGFDDLVTFGAWFFPKTNTLWAGKIIHFTKLKY